MIRSQHAGGAEHGTVWPEHPGVAGVSLHAASSSLRQRLGSAARDAVATWIGSAGTRGGHAAAEFPYADVLDHYRAVGRMAASVSLVGDLVELGGPAEATDPPDRQLARWLRVATDQRDGDYHTYAATALHEDFLERVPFGGPERSTDLLTLALVVDLLRAEAAALASAPTAAQRRRTDAVVHAVRRAGELAPDAASAAPDVSAVVGAIRRGAADGELAERAAQVAAHAGIPAVVADLIDLTLIPVTPLHDEHMFLRSIQAFECVFAQGARKVALATVALQERDPGRAAGLLAEATTRFRATSALYRILATMPAPAFAIIRKYTAGRSAIQSRTYRRVELACAPRDDGPDPAMPSLQEVFLGAEPRLTVAIGDRLRAAMRRLDDSWRVMKRTHWGITLRLIGDARGTGGTSGASHLYAASLLPLFPAVGPAVGPAAGTAPVAQSWSRTAQRSGNAGLPTVVRR